MAYVFEAMEGWCTRDVFLQMEHVNLAQKNNNVIGNVAEIGVHHGRFFLFLLYLQKDKEYAIGVDIFENQKENISQSGGGSLISLVHNYVNCLAAKMRICLVKDNSLNLSKCPNLFTFNNLLVRIFSVDGGHSAVEVTNDLNLAHLVMHDSGVIIVDDYQHCGWDDVFSATNSWLSTHQEYIPFMIGGNKLFICRKDKQHLFKNVPTLWVEEYLTTVNYAGLDQKNIDFVRKKCLHAIHTWPDIKLFSEKLFNKAGNA